MRNIFKNLLTFSKIFANLNDIILETSGGKVAMKETDLILATLIQIADAVVNIFPKSLEVVVHDMREPQSSIKYIAGNVTNRHIGGPITDYGIRALQEEGDYVRDKYGYKTNSKDGRDLKSSTCFLRNSDGKVTAAFCINIDITELLNAQQVLDSITNSLNITDNHNSIEHFASTIDETIDALFERAVNKVGKQPASMSKDDKVDLVNELDKLGVFQIKGGVEHVGKRIGVTKYTVYNYLKTKKNKAV